MEQFQEGFLSNEQDMDITGETGDYLIETSKWAKFIAVTIFIVTGLCALLVFFYGSFVGGLRYTILGGSDFFGLFVFILLLIVAIIVVTYYFLISFANKMRLGIETENIEVVNKGLNSLKIHFIIIGILAILNILLNLFKLLKSPL